MHPVTQGGSVTLEDCTITSSTGSGVAAEGGEHVIRRCRLFGCERHGLAVFGTLDGDGCQAMHSFSWVGFAGPCLWLTAVPEPPPPPPPPAFACHPQPSSNFTSLAPLVNPPFTPLLELSAVLCPALCSRRPEGSI